MLATALFVRRHAHMNTLRVNTSSSAAKVVSLARIRIEGRPREEKVQGKEPRVYYVQATHARQCCPLYLRWLYLYLCSSDLTVHEPRGRLGAPPFIACQEEGVGYINGYLCR